MMMMLVMMMIAVDDGDSRRLMVALATTHRSRQWRRWWCGQITTSDSTTSGSTGSVLSVSAKFVRIQPTDRRVATVSQCGCYELWGHSMLQTVPSLWARQEFAVTTMIQRPTRTSAATPMAGARATMMMIAIPVIRYARRGTVATGFAYRSATTVLAGTNGT
uniref:Putative secreted protein n=1 Tax=Anopheles darlingi TaxID=43151 RepID=A0A2M4D4M4_ANODA